MSKNKKEEFIELTVESIGFEGISIAKKEGKTYFVRNGLPGDVVIVQLLKKHRRYTETRIKEFIKLSELRTEPFCKYFGICGGCSWQNLKYEEQLKWKKLHVIDAYQRLGKIEGNFYNNTLSANQQKNYRNKMDFSFSSSRWLTLDEINSNEILDKNFALGLHVLGCYDKTLDIDFCGLQNPVWNDILNIVRSKAKELNISAYNTNTYNGFLKGLCLRYSLKDNETMSILITNTPKEDKDIIFLDWYKDELKKQIPQIVSIVHAVNTHNNVNVGEISFINGKKFITENILGIDYQISPFSFFQTNSYQLNNFIKLIIDSANVNKNDIVWDLYCGTGTISLPISKHCKEVYGIELVESAINDAKKNSQLNNLNNTFFYTADLHNKQIPELLNKLKKPDVIILDPPRSGIHPRLLEHLLEISSKRIIYVSCNPTTQARDLTILKEKYNILEVSPVDMFPHTYHIETITKLEKK